MIMKTYEKPKITRIGNILESIGHNHEAIIQACAHHLEQMRASKTIEERRAHAADLAVCIDILDTKTGLFSEREVT